MDVYDGLTGERIALGQTLFSRERGDAVTVVEVGTMLDLQGNEVPHVMLRSGMRRPYEGRVSLPESDHPVLIGYSSAR